jgi:hypothetical protein
MCILCLFSAVGARGVPVDAVLTRFAAKYLDLFFARTILIITYKSVRIVHLALSDSTPT